MERSIRGNKKGKWCRVPGYLPDIMPTILEATGAKYPETYHGGNKIYPLVGSSLFLLSIRKRTPCMNICITRSIRTTRAIRWRDWKAIRDEKARR
ncbi:hypothetical protein NXW89_00150 [Bacteroides thetaiotaomicron]|nr:hypothetical protein [Bacteroides thetaiotaomicron]